MSETVENKKVKAGNMELVDSHEHLTQNRPALLAERTIGDTPEISRPNVPSNKECEQYNPPFMENLKSYKSMQSGYLGGTTVSK